MLNFSYQNTKVSKEKEGSGVVANGEIINCSGRSYNAVTFRVILFSSNTNVGEVVITINGFINGQLRTFEKRIGDLEYDKIVREVNRLEIYPESAY